MNLSSRMVIVLTSVGLISGGLLATVGLLTKERIELNKQKEIQEAIIQVVPGTQSSQKIYEQKDLTVYEGKTLEGGLAGYALYVSGVGFQDKITLMVGIDPSLAKMNSLKVLDQKETPGLGAKITSPELFLIFWENKDISRPLSLRKPPVSSPDQLAPTEVNTITGATISSEAVLGIVNTALEEVKRLREEGRLSNGGSHAH